MVKVVMGAIGGLLGVVLLVSVLGIGGGVSGSAVPAGGCATSPGAVHATTGQSTQVDAALNADQMSIARTIIAVGKGMGVTQRGTAIALGTAMQESTLNPTITSGRSIGLFQQQGELYAAVIRTDPTDTSRAFYEQLLKRVPQYDDAAAVSFADAAQTVQASGAGASWYARWEQWATTLAGQLYAGTPAQDVGIGTLICKPGGGSGPIRVMVRGTTITLPAEAGIAGELVMPDKTATTVVAAALSYLGTRYSWGGGNATGPTKGIRDGGVADVFGDYLAEGFDCSGLMEYAFAQAGITVPGTSQPQQLYGRSLPWGNAQPGDMVFWGRPAHHVALYIGTLNQIPYMVEAPESGSVVKVSPVRTTASDFDPLVVRAWQHDNGAGT
ncbi:MAG: NlpC/P60 family protein [Umezawaea sp.]